MTKQRHFMIEIWKKCKGSVPEVIAEYAHAEHMGKVGRKKNTNLISAEKYGEALIRDGLKKGWLF